MYTLYHGDCLAHFGDVGLVDAVITDPPFGTTSCKWDSVIPFDDMWAGIESVIVPRAPILLFGVDPFTSALIGSKLNWYKYKWYWKKNRPGNFAVMKYMPGSVVEEIAVFGRKGNAINYYPQMVKREKPRKHGGRRSQKNGRGFGGVANFESRLVDVKHPTNLLEFPCVVRQRSLHPTQKPVALIEYLIKTYTKPGDTILDFSMGSGTTGVAAMQTDRNFVGIELDGEYFSIAKKRIDEAFRSASGEMIPIKGKADHGDLPLFDNRELV